MLAESQTYETLKKIYDILKDDLNLSKEKIEKFEKEQITSIKDMSDKPLDKNELALQDFIIYGSEKPKLASMIYGVSKSKIESFGYHQKPYNPIIDILMKPSNPSSLSTAQKRLNAYFMHAAENGRILN